MKKCAKCGCVYIRQGGNAYICNDCGHAHQIPAKLYFVLGGDDLEMSEIKKILAANGTPYSQANPKWGASVADNISAIKKALSSSLTPVLVELQIGGLTERELKKCVIVDHHGDSSKRPASILQVLGLIGISPNRRSLLIAANDSGYIQGMIEMGATKDEILSIRKEDWAAQGITAQQTKQCEVALKAAKVYEGGLTVVTLPHSKTAPVMDSQTINGFHQTIVYSPNEDEVNFTGNGGLCKALKEWSEVQSKGGCSWGGNAAFGNKHATSTAYSGFSGKQIPLEAIVRFCSRYLINLHNSKQ